MKKLLFVIESLHFGGAEKSLVTLLNQTDLSAWHVEVWVNAPGGVLEAELPPRVTVKKIPRRLPTIYERVRLYLLKKFQSKKYNSSQIIWKAFSATYAPVEEYFDIAIAYHQGLPTYYVLDKINAGKKIGWMNTDYESAGYNTAFDRPVFKRLHKLVAVSEYAKETVVRSFPAEDFASKTVVLEDFIDRENIIKRASEKNLLDDDKGLKLVTVGRLNITKGYLLAVEAARILKTAEFNFKWYFVGEGDQRTKIEKMIEAYGLRDHVVLLGAALNPYQYMRAADIYVQTSVFEGFSISVREAKVLNKPIACTNFPSIAGALEDGVNALITGMNAESIAAAVQRLITDSTLREKLALRLIQENRQVADRYSEQVLHILEN